MNTDSFIIRVKTEDIYKDIAENVKTRFDTSNYQIDRSLPMRKNEKVIALMKDELGGKIMKKFVGLREKKYSYLKDNEDKDKKAKETKKCIVKGRLKFRDYEKCLKASQIENEINYLEKKENNADSLTEIMKYKLVILKHNIDLKGKDIMFLLK